LFARRVSLFWRIHFWAALIASPFALVAALTGILYIFTPQIEAALYRGLEQTTPAVVMRPLDEAVAAATAAAPPGWDLLSVAPAYRPGDTVKLVFAPGVATPGVATPGVATPGAVAGGHEGHQHGRAKAAAPKFGLPARALLVYVDPSSAMVLGNLPAQERFGIWAQKLHSRLLQGEGWRWMIELAASWMLVMLLTGVYLWWPRGGRRVLPAAGARGRSAWRQWHAFLGVALGAVTFVILVTGLTWSKYAGEQVRLVRDASGQASPQAPPGLRSTLVDGAEPLSWDGAWQAARRQAPDVALQLTAPRAAGDTWRASAAGRGQPEKRFDLQFDAYSGRALYYAGWERQTLFGKATAIGIRFHRGEFGWWNQALLLVFGASVVFSLLSGWVMFFKRRRAGALSLPRLLPGAWKSASPLAWLTLAVLCAAMPLLALSGCLLVLLEVALHRPWRGV